MNPLDEEERIDFITKKNRTKYSELFEQIPEDWQKETEEGNSKLEMRIVSASTNDNNVVSMQLIFKLDYFPKEFAKAYFMFATKTIDFYDANRLIESEPTGVLAVWFIGKHYQESVELLYKKFHKELTLKLKKASFIGDFTITEEQAEEEVLKVMRSYFKPTS